MPFNESQLTVDASDSYETLSQAKEGGSPVKLPVTQQLSPRHTHALLRDPQIPWLMKLDLAGLVSLVCCHCSVWTRSHLPRKSHSVVLYLSKADT